MIRLTITDGLDYKSHPRLNKKKQQQQQQQISKAVYSILK